MRSYYNNNLKYLKVFGRWLAGQRKARFWSQSELAERLDVSQNSVSRWETGEAFPSLSNLQKIAELFGVTTDDIFSMMEKASCTGQEPEQQSVAEHNAMQDPDRKTPESRIRELEAELSLLRAENRTLKEKKHELEMELGSARAEYLTLKENNRQLKAAMQQFIG
ncbi:MAG: helix-turn-helix domain-containing protein [Acidaminococcaceae bacterium]|nr:helix-turn-helix domain-containing protein [Acidaminococcaceae bacterium]